MVAKLEMTLTKILTQDVIEDTQFATISKYVCINQLEWVIRHEGMDGYLRVKCFLIFLDLFTGKFMELCIDIDHFEAVWHLDTSLLGVNDDLATI